jgi:hypothetical protein
MDIANFNRKTIFFLLFIFPFTVFSQQISKSKSNFDSLEYAPGYPNYSVSQIDQLKSFPLPRYKTGTTLNRNFSWFDFLYMAYDYSKTTIGKDNHFLYPGWNNPKHAHAALNMNVEMYLNWNYYFNIASPTYNYGNFSNPNTIPGAQVKYADEHPDVETCTYLFWGGIRVKDGGYNSPKPFIKSNSNIDPCKGDSFPNIARDGKTQRFYLSKLAAALPHRDSLRKIDFVNENGEVFGEAWTPNAEGYRGNDLIKCIQPDSGNARAFRARWQYKVFNTYKSQFIGNDSLPGFKNSYFSFYQVAGFLPDYYSEWSEMRKINSSFHNSYYSTPDFYPGQADHSIFPRYSFYHGLDCIEEGRKHEISLGDYYFSPFIAGGWFEDSLNYRPAAWLAATKALAMMGAEFYYPAFFNTSNPATKKPIDPRGYIYQIAVPAYAQAITSRYEKIFFDSKDFTYSEKDNRLFIYRKDNSNSGGPVYAIHTSVFSPGNFTAPPNEVSETANIDGDKLKLNFRKQGSTYIYDKSDPSNIVFYQLDKWQESSHPYYWSKNFDFEAELYDDTTHFHLATELPVGADKNDYTNFTTYVRFENSVETNKSLNYHFEPRKDTGIYYIWVHVRSSAKNPEKISGLSFSVDGHSTYVLKNIEKDKFQWYCVAVKEKPIAISISPDIEHVLTVKALDQFVELDRIILSTTKTPLEIQSVK